MSVDREPLDREMSFKGGRDYLHSTTLFDDLLQLLGAPGGAIDFKFDKRTGRQVSYQTEQPVPGQVLVASWRDPRGTTFVVERDAAIVRSVAYDEDGLAQRFVFSTDSVALPGDVGGHSMIEAVVAGFKALLQRTVAGKSSKLAFVRLRLQSLPEVPLEIRFARRIGEFYQGDIRADGALVGQIFFGEWR